MIAIGITIALLLIAWRIGRSLPYGKPSPLWP